MLLYEELFLLSLNEKKGAVSRAAAANIGFGLSGGILSELLLAERISIDAQKHVVVLNAGETGEKLLDEVLKKISEYPRQHKESFWVNRLADGVKKLKGRVGMGLVEKGVLKLEKKRYLWVIPYEAFPEVDTSAKYWVKQRLREVVLAAGKSDAHVIALLRLIRTCEMLEFVFTRDELKAARHKIDELTNNEEIGDGLRSPIVATTASITTSAG